MKLKKEDKTRQKLPVDRTVMHIHYHRTIH